MSFIKKQVRKELNSSIFWKITRNCFSMIAESAKSLYPKEFAGLIRCDEELKDTITEIVLLPGTIAGDSHALFKMHMKPFDLALVGTVHSHPSHFFQPSEADMMLFRKYGKIHMIIAFPFSFSSWGAYNAYGEEVAMHII